MEIQYTFERYEQKYLLTPKQYTEVLGEIGRRMEKDVHGHYTICNVYFDTGDYELIRRSLDKPVYKEKFRIRSYGTPKGEDTVFAELKKKYGGIVYKRRVAATAKRLQAFLEKGDRLAGDSQIQGEIRYFLGRYHPEPKVFLAYDRTAFTGEKGDLRVTFDENLRYRTEGLDLQAGEQGEAVLTEPCIVMEVKTGGAVPLWLARMFCQQGIFPASFSKYGICYKRHIVPRWKERKESAYDEQYSGDPHYSDRIFDLPGIGYGGGGPDSAGVYIQEQA